MVKINLRKLVIAGGLAAILGCSEKVETYSSKPENQKNQEQNGQITQPNKSDLNDGSSQIQKVSSIVYFYDSTEVEQGEGVDNDFVLSDLCRNYKFSLFTIASNAESAKKRFNLADKSVMLIYQNGVEVERFFAENRWTLAKQLEQELMYHSKKGNPPPGCRDYKKQ